MKKWMLYINAIHDGGAERVLVNLAKYFAEQGIDTTLVTSFRDSWEYPLDPRVRRLTLEEEQLHQSRLQRNVGRIAKLRRLCRQEKPDLLLAFMAEPNFRAVMATRGLPLKTVVSVRNDPEREYAGKAGRLVGKCLLPLADGCVFQTQDAKAWFPEKLQKKSAIIYNAVKPEFYEVQRLPVPGEIVTCGRLEEQKNHALLIEAFARMQERRPDTVLKIYGEGSLRPMLERQIAALGLTDKVLLMGATNNVAAALRTASLFVLSSDYEGMPNALMEAMAAGVPCVSTDCPCGGPRELFGAELANRLVPCRDAAALADAMEHALTGPEDGKAFRQRAAEFAPHKVYGAWVGYLEQVIQGKPRHGN